MSRVIARAAVIAAKHDLQLIARKDVYELWDKDGKTCYGSFKDPNAVLRMVVNAAFASRLAKEVDEIRASRQHPPLNL